MEPAPDVDGAAKASPLFAKYGTRVDAQSAREMLAARVESAVAGAQATATAQADAPAAPAPAPAKKKEAATAIAGGAEVLGNFLNSREGKQIQKEVIRGVFGMLKKKL